jgi:hypothetical protein
MFLAPLTCRTQTSLGGLPEGLGQQVWEQGAVGQLGGAGEAQVECVGNTKARSRDRQR